MHFGYFGKAGIQSIRKPPEMAGNINYFYLRQQRDLYHYEFQQIEAQLNRLGGRIAYVNAVDWRSKFSKIAEASGKEILLITEIKGS